MTDKERILLTIINRLYFQYSQKIPWESKPDGVYFAPWMGSVCDGFGNLKPGMLVMCMTSRNIHDWTVGILYEKIYDGWAIKEIGSDRICNVTNEAFIPIEGMSEISLLTGDNFKFYQKVLKVFRKSNLFNYRFGGIEIIEKRKWKIFIREAFGGIGLLEKNEESVPFFCIVEWNKKTAIKFILQKMIEAGYGTKKFERKQRIK